MSTTFDHFASRHLEEQGDERFGEANQSLHLGHLEAQSADGFDRAK